MPWVRTHWEIQNSYASLDSTRWMTLAIASRLQREVRGARATHLNKMWKWKNVVCCIIMGKNGVESPYVPLGMQGVHPPGRRAWYRMKASRLGQKMPPIL